MRRSRRLTDAPKFSDFSTGMPTPKRVPAFDRDALPGFRDLVLGASSCGPWPFGPAPFPSSPLPSAASSAHAASSATNWDSTISW